MDNGTVSTETTEEEIYFNKIGEERHNRNNTVWKKEEISTTSNSSLKTELKKFFAQFLTQLVWGFIINLRVGFIVIY
jgi:hypothetical protein